MNRISLLAFSLGLSAAFNVSAESALQYRVNGQESTQPIVIKDGKVLIPGLDGQNHPRDLLYDRAVGEAILIDHKSHTYIKLDRNSIDRVSRQTEPLQPLLAGIGAQLKNLSPEQKAKWQEMLGGIDIDKLAAASENSKPMRISKEGKSRKIGSFTCTTATVARGKNPVAEVCLSEGTALGLTQDDYTTLRSLLEFTERVAKKTQGLSGLMGFSIPVVAVQELPGIPVEIRSVGRKQTEQAQLASVDPAFHASTAMAVPDGYRGEELKLW